MLTILSLFRSSDPFIFLTSASIYLVNALYIAFSTVCIVQLSALMALTDIIVFQQ